MNIQRFNRLKTISVPEEDLARQRMCEERFYELFRKRSAPPLACVDTFGCQQNVADGQILRGMLKRMGFLFTEKPEEADLVALNTCAVREHAEQRVMGHLGALSHTKRNHPDQIIILCGCMAAQERISRRVRESYPHVDLVFGPQVLWKFPELLWQVWENCGRVFDAGTQDAVLAENLPMDRDAGVRAWLSVMYGCDNFCSYCIVPYVRGRERSRQPERILDEARDLIAAGYRDLTLLGQNVNSYGKGLAPDNTGHVMDFPELIREIDKIPGDYWIRFTSSHPKDAGPKLFDAMAECTHTARQLHLPFQSGSDRVLAAMNRRYTREQYLNLIRYARSVMPDLTITSDVIIGFPGETEQEAMETISLVEEVGFDALFTFIYSPRPGTKAAEMPDPVPRAEKQKWFDRLLEVQNSHSAAQHAALVGKTLRVLVDGKTRNRPGNAAEAEEFPITGRTEGNRLVRLKGDTSLIGNFTDVKITGSNTWALYGETLPDNSKILPDNSKILPDNDNKDK